MKRAKRKALLKLLRSKFWDSASFCSQPITPDAAGKVDVREWLNVWEKHARRQHGNVGEHVDFISDELRKVLKSIDKDAEYNFYWPSGRDRQLLDEIPIDLTISFVAPSDLSEAGRVMARKWLEENFSGSKTAVSVRGRKYPLVMGSAERLVGDGARSILGTLANRFIYNGKQSEESVLDWKHPLMDQTLRLSAPKDTEEMISMAEYGERKALLRRGGKPKPEYEPETMADFVARVERTLRHINPSPHQPQPAVDATVSAEFFDKEHKALVEEAVKEFGLAKAMEYRPMPAKPEGYAVYNALSAINELEKGDEE